MDSETESIKSHTESEEDDFGNYFLQPSTSPYNITKKVMEANVDLFNTNLYLNNGLGNGKLVKVKFREELVSFEPDLTDDDINSIESDHVEVLMDNCPLFFEYKTTIISNDENIFYKHEEREKESQEDVIIEDIENEQDESIKAIQSGKKSNETTNAETRNIMHNSIIGSSNTNNKRKKTVRTKQTFLHSDEICCKSHCIDKLDFDLSMSIKKLDIHEKVKIPPLQLLQRGCCKQVKQKISLKLPSYNGQKSEYGLTSTQLENLKKQKETNKLKKQKRRQLMQQYRQRRIHESEKVFCQWLKDVSRRKFKNKNCKKQKIKNQDMLNPISMILDGCFKF